MDYDVEVRSLTSPPSTAPTSTYRPAVSVRNNGLHDALASGVLRIYSAGLLTFTTELYSPTIPPGETKDALTIDYWTPAEGTYEIVADISSPLDMVESNNHLPPTRIVISGTAPTPPAPVPVHAAQHEDGGTDEVSIDGLKGRTADRQQPLDHAAQHQAGGSDALNVDSLLGTLAEDQPAQVHDNTRHNPPMATASGLTAHQGATSAHSAATNLANRDLSGVDAGLVNGAQLAPSSEFPNHPRMALLMDRHWGIAKHASIGANFGPLQTLPSHGRFPLLSLNVPEGWLSDDMQFIFEAHCFASSLTADVGEANLYLMLGTTQLAFNIITVYPGTTNLVNVSGHALGEASDKATGAIDLLLSRSGVAYPIFQPVSDGGLVSYNKVNTSLRLDCELISNNPLFLLLMNSGYIRALHPIP